MFKTPNSVKGLRQYYKDRLGIPSVEHFEAEITGQSDRAFVILLTSLLDDALTYRLSRSLVFPVDEPKYDYVFRFEGPLGTFSARIEIGYIFGFIDELTRNQLTDLREMRNACAHSKHRIDFGVPQLAAVAKRLFYPNGVFPLIEDTPIGIRRSVYAEFLILYHVFTMGSRPEAEAFVKRAFEKHGVQFPWLDKPPQP
jgi:hypothetical protein